MKKEELLKNQKFKELARLTFHYHEMYVQSADRFFDEFNVELVYHDCEEMEFEDEKGRMISISKKEIDDGCGGV